MQVTRMTCRACDVSVEAKFPDSPLARLPVEHQRFIEIFVLAGGSLKEIASQAGVSYPTVRSRLDKVIQQLGAELEAQQKETKKKKGSGKVDQESAAQILKNI
jgi:hypothetical protein